MGKTICLSTQVGTYMRMEGKEKERKKTGNKERKRDYWD